MTEKVLATWMLIAALMATAVIVVTCQAADVAKERSEYIDAVKEDMAGDLGMSMSMECAVMEFNWQRITIYTDNDDCTKTVTYETRKVAERLIAMMMEDSR